MNALIPTVLLAAPLLLGLSPATYATTSGNHDIVFVVSQAPDMQNPNGIIDWLAGTPGQLGAIRRLRDEILAQPAGQVPLNPRFGLVLFGGGDGAGIPGEGGGAGGPGGPGGPSGPGGGNATSPGGWVRVVDFSDDPFMPPTSDDLWVDWWEIEKLESALRDPSNLGAPNASGNQGQDALLRVVNVDPIPGDAFSTQPAFAFRDGSVNVVFVSDLEPPFGDAAERERRYGENPNDPGLQLQLEQALQSHGAVLDTLTPSLFSGNKPEGDPKNLGLFHLTGWSPSAPPDPFHAITAKHLYLQPHTADAHIDLNEYRDFLQYLELYTGNFGSQVLIEETWSLKARIRVAMASKGEIRFGANLGQLPRFTFDEITNEWRLEPPPQLEGILPSLAFEPYSDFPDLVPMIHFVAEIRALPLVNGNYRYDLFIDEVPVATLETGFYVADSGGSMMNRALRHVQLTEARTISWYDWLRFRVVGPDASTTTLPLAPADPTPVDLNDAALPYAEILFQDFGDGQGASPFCEGYYAPTGPELNIGTFGVDYLDGPENAVYMQNPSQGLGFEQRFHGDHASSTLHFGAREQYSNIKYISLADATHGQSWTLLPVVGVTLDVQNFTNAFVAGLTDQILCGICGGN